MTTNSTNQCSGCKEILIYDFFPCCPKCGYDIQQQKGESVE